MEAPCSLGPSVLCQRSFGGELLTGRIPANMAADIVIFLGAVAWLGNVALWPSVSFLKCAKWFD